MACVLPLEKSCFGVTPKCRPIQILSVKCITADKYQAKLAKKSELVTNRYVMNLNVNKNKLSWRVEIMSLCSKFCQSKLSLENHLQIYTGVRRVHTFIKFSGIMNSTFFVLFCFVFLNHKLWTTHVYDIEFNLLWPSLHRQKTWLPEYQLISQSLWSLLLLVSEMEPWFLVNIFALPKIFTLQAASS